MQFRPPGPSGLGILSMLLEFQRDPLKGLMNLVNRYGDVLSYRCGPFSFVLINHPYLVQRVLV